MESIGVFITPQIPRVDAMMARSPCFFCITHTRIYLLLMIYLPRTRIPPDNAVSACCSLFQAASHTVQVLIGALSLLSGRTYSKGREFSRRP